ncbi:hypothetical protein MTBLM5_330006 [Magnetospirillum sp. LM-5]|nr:hypothetical protein MTBLM5_330006 [Magnetospirillum sp. LM-5]
MQLPALADDQQGAARVFRSQGGVGHGLGGPRGAVAFRAGLGRDGAGLARARRRGANHLQLATDIQHQRLVGAGEALADRIVDLGDGHPIHRHIDHLATLHGDVDILDEQGGDGAGLTGAGDGFGQWRQDSDAGRGGLLGNGLGDGIGIGLVDADGIQQPADIIHRLLEGAFQRFLLFLVFGIAVGRAGRVFQGARIVQIRGLELMAQPRLGDRAALQHLLHVLQARAGLGGKLDGIFDRQRLLGGRFDGIDQLNARLHGSQRILCASGDIEIVDHGRDPSRQSADKKLRFCEVTHCRQNCHGVQEFPSLRLGNFTTF